MCSAEKVVGVRGFEPPAPCSQSTYANRTAPHPEEISHTRRRI